MPKEFGDAGDQLSALGVVQVVATEVRVEYVEDSRRYAVGRVKTQTVPGRIRKSQFKDLVRRIQTIQIKMPNCADRGVVGQQQIKRGAGNFVHDAQRSQEPPRERGFTDAKIAK